MALTFNEKAHEYLWNGKFVPSATQVPNLVAVRNLVDGEYSRWLPASGWDFSAGTSTAAAFGTALHAVIHAKQAGLSEEHDPALDPWIRGWEKYMAKYPQANYAFSELPMYCSYGYATTPDALYEFDHGDAILIDWKSGGFDRAKFALQMAAGAYAVKDYLKLRRIPKARVVCLVENDFTEHDFTESELRIAFNLFLSLLNIWKSFHKNSMEGRDD